jgi:hypothetical protein
MVLSLAVPFASGSLLSSCVMDEVGPHQLLCIQQHAPVDTAMLPAASVLVLVVLCDLRDGRKPYQAQLCGQ